MTEAEFHQIRSNLHAVYMAVDVLKMEGPSHEQDMRILEIMKRNIEGVLKILEGLKSNE